jgi:hypothetical protein
MEQLDELVTTRIIDELLTRERVRKLLEGLIERQNGRDAQKAQSLAGPRQELDAKETTLGRLYKLVADGPWTRPSRP